MRCPICLGDLRRRRPSFPDEQPPQANLPAGWDCLLLHALRTPPGEYEQARVDLLISDVSTFLTFQQITAELHLPGNDARTPRRESSGNEASDRP